MTYDLIAIRLPKLLAGLCLLAGVAINCANVFGRYFLGAPIFWAEEAMIFLVIWSIFLGFVSVTASRAHLKMDLVTSALPAAGRNWIMKMGLVLGIIMMTYLALQSWHSLAKLFQFGMRSIALEVPMIIPHFAVFVGFAGSAIATLALLWSRSE